MRRFIAMALLVLPIYVTALPLSIVPATSLPTTVYEGASTSAHYTVTNLTQGTQSNIFVKYLPANVTQLTTGTNTCGTSFTLAPNGSCILRLRITGAVDDSNQNISDHLLLCLQGGIFCVGPTPANSLNVTEVAAPVDPNFMVALGQYQSDVSLPDAYRSTNKGVSWTQATIPPPFIIGYNNVVSAVACGYNTLHCAGIGYASGSATTLISYYTTDGGDIWLNSNTSPVSPDPAITMSSMSCNSTGLQCVAVGSYGNTPSTPVAYTTTDGGENWSNPITNFPTPTSFTAALSVACDSTATHCVAVGFYGANFLDPYYPLVYISTNGGATWSISPGTPGQYLGDSTELTNVSCDTNATHCVAVGYYAPDVNTFNSVSYYSNDGGVSWTISDTIPPEIGAFNSRPTGLDCNLTGLNCAIVGRDTDNGPNDVCSWYSTDGGVNWAISNTVPPGQSTIETAIGGVFCSGLNCVSSGFYFDNSSNQIPVGYYSSDGGNNWALTSGFSTNEGNINANAGSQ